MDNSLTFGVRSALQTGRAESAGSSLVKAGSRDGLLEEVALKETPEGEDLKRTQPSGDVAWRGGRGLPLRSGCPVAPTPALLRAFVFPARLSALRFPLPGALAFAVPSAQNAVAALLPGRHGRLQDSDPSSRKPTRSSSAAP